MDRGRFSGIRLWKGEKGDTFRQNGPRLVNFRFLLDGFEDGLDWRTTGGGLTFTLLMNGKNAAPFVSLGFQPFGAIQALTFRLAP